MSVYLVAAYAVFWTLPVILIVTMWVRQRRIERQIAELREFLDRPGQPAPPSPL